MFRKVQPSKPEPTRSRKYEQANDKHWNWNNNQKSSNESWG